MTEVFAGKKEDLLYVMLEMKNEGRSDSESCKKFADFLASYQAQVKHLIAVQNDIERSVYFQRKSNALDSLLHSERQDT